MADCLEDGCLAVGIEGSDYSRRIGRAEWSQIPDYLFCADITAPFTVAVAGAEPPTPVQFDLITMCEVIEHIAEADLPQVAENIRRHLAPGGLCVLSVAPYPDSADDVAWHQTVRPREWWLATFAALGFQHLPAVVEFFNGHFVRGPQQKSPGSFHLVLTTAPDQAPPVPRCGLGQRLMDRWQGSRWQRRLRQLVLGDGPLGDG